MIAVKMGSVVRMRFVTLADKNPKLALYNPKPNNVGPTAKIDTPNQPN